MNKVDMVDDEELLDLVEMEIRELLARSHEFDGRRHPGHSVVSALKGTGSHGRRLRSDSHEDLQPIYDAHGLRSTSYIPDPRFVTSDKDFLMPIEDVFSIDRSRHRRHRSYRARHHQR